MWLGWTNFIFIFLLLGKLRCKAYASAPPPPPPPNIESGGTYAHPPSHEPPYLVNC